MGNDSAAYVKNPLVIPEDVLIIPVAELPPDILMKVEHEADDYAITRPHARTPSKVIDAASAELLDLFRKPKTIVEAIVEYSRTTRTNPEEVLTNAFPILRRLIGAQLLVHSNSAAASNITASLSPGDVVAGTEVIRCIQVLEDTELCEVRAGDRSAAALKILRTDNSKHASMALRREAEVLRHLDGRVNPSLIESGTHDGRPFLIMEWIPGVPASVAAERTRHQANAESRPRLLKLCSAILDAYRILHEQGVIHSDVHPKNILVSSDCSVRLIDFGLSRVVGGVELWDEPPRGGIGFFFEPEYAAARRDHKKPPPSSYLGEQYSLAALLYYLLTGQHYIDFSPEKDKLYEQITSATPLPFASSGLHGWAEIEGVLNKALNKEPEQRYPSVDEFAESLRKAVTVESSSSLATGESHDALDVQDARQVLDKVLDHFLESAEISGKLSSTVFETSPTCSVFYGAAGIAYSLYRIASVRGDSKLAALADYWGLKARQQASSEGAFYCPEIELTPEVAGRISAYHTSGGIYCVQSLIGHAMGDFVSQQFCMEAFISASESDCDSLDLTLGRSSTLLASSILLEAMPPHSLLNPTPLRDFGGNTMNSIWLELDSFSPVPLCTEFPFTGIAHGWAGVLYATLRWCQSAGAERPAALERRLFELGECGEPIGKGLRWRRKIRDAKHPARDTYLTGWCNGTAGLIHLWALAHKIFNDDRYLQLAEKAAWHVWEDQQDAAADLCCGHAGRAYGLLKLYQHTGQREWLLRASDLAARAAAGIYTASLRLSSLYKGVAGVAALAADLAAPRNACMPFFAEEGWPRS